MYRYAAAAVVSGLLTLAITMSSGHRPALGHGWYPKECCSDHDCVLADAIVPDERGGKIVVVRQTRIPIPEGFTARASPTAAYTYAS